MQFAVQYVDLTNNFVCTMKTEMEEANIPVNASVEAISISFPDCGSALSRFSPSHLTSFADQAHPSFHLPHRFNFLRFDSVNAFAAFTDCRSLPIAGSPFSSADSSILVINPRESTLTTGCVTQRSMVSLSRLNADHFAEESVAHSYDLIRRVMGQTSPLMAE
jgi:hypothetical protein